MVISLIKLQTFHFLSLFFPGGRWFPAHFHRLHESFTKMLETILSCVIHHRKKTFISCSLLSHRQTVWTQTGLILTMTVTNWHKLVIHYDGLHNLSSTQECQLGFMMYKIEFRPTAGKSLKFIRNVQYSGFIVNKRNRATILLKWTGWTVNPQV